MTVLLKTLWNMSVQASWIILAVMIVRTVFRNQTKKFRHVLWAIAGFRLICPFSLEIPFAFGMRENIITGTDTVRTITEYAVMTENTPDHGLSGMEILTVVWLMGVVLLGLYTLIRCHQLKTGLSGSCRTDEDIIVCDTIQTPFVMGILKPWICLPSCMDEKSLKYVIDHERMHIRYHDPLIKLLAWILTCIHWFNPVIWIGYRLFCQDVELVCDERVIEHYNAQQKADYSLAMVNAGMLSSGKSMVYPLGFGETDVKVRIRSVMNYRKPGFLFRTACIILCAGMAGCFLTNPQDTSFRLQITVPAGSAYEFHYASGQVMPESSQLKVKCEEGHGEFSVVLRKCDEKDGEPVQMYMEPGYSVDLDVEKGIWYDFGILASNESTEDMTYTMRVSPVEMRIEEGVYGELEQYRSSYVGDAANTTGLAMNLPYGADLRYDHIALQTDVMPYGMTVYLKGSGNGENLQKCAQTAFDLIGNLDEITFAKADSEEVIAAYIRDRLWAEKKEPIDGTWKLTIGNENVCEIAIQMEKETLCVKSANGTCFGKGEQVALTDLAGDVEASIAALDSNREILWKAYVRNGMVEGMDMKISEADDWHLELS
ncbi:MAG: M56 family metallopeptidase [Bulleidia sp.]